MSRVTPFLVLAAAAAIPSVATATYSESFGNLEGELEFRRTYLYPEVPSKAQLKELKAIDKALEAIDADSDGLADDGKTLVKVVKGLMKAFPAEFETSEGPTPFPNFFTSLLANFQNEIENDLMELDALLPGLSLKGAARVQKFLDQAEAALAEETDGYQDAAKALSRAAAAAAKAAGVVEGDPGPATDLTLTANGTNIRDDILVISYDEFSGLFTFTVTDSGTTTRIVQLTAGIEGVGSYTPLSTMYTVAPLPLQNYIATSSGSLNVSALSTSANTISFTIDVTATGQLGTAGTAHVVGSYTGPYTDTSAPL